MTEAYDNYPLGAANNPDAPWNEEDKEPIKIEVMVSITLSKTVEISVDDYSLTHDEDGYPCYDTSECDLIDKVEEQIILPHEAHNYIQGNTNLGKTAIKDLKGWIVDDLEVIKE